MNERLRRVQETWTVTKVRHGHDTKRDLQREGTTSTFDTRSTTAFMTTKFMTYFGKRCLHDGYHATTSEAILRGVPSALHCTQVYSSGMTDSESGKSALGLYSAQIRSCDTTFPLVSLGLYEPSKHFLKASRTTCASTVTHLSLW